MSADTAVAATAVPVATMSSDHPAVKLSLSILDVAKSAQMEHGLRHKDFEGYRQYCTRRLRRIRQCKQVQFLHKEPTTAQKKSRKGKFAQKELTEELATDSKHLQIPLFNAERAWSYAMEMKVEFNASQSGRARQRMGKRLKKAVEWAKKLSELCAAVADDRTRLEAEAYSSEMQARWHFERDEAVEALPLLATARSIYQGLAPVGLPRERRLFAQQAAEIAPMERMCRFHIARARHAAGGSASSGAGSDVDAAVAERLAALVAQAEAAAAASVGNSVVTGDGDDVRVSWQGVSIEVADPGIRKVLVAIRTKEAELAADALATDEDGGEDGDIDIADEEEGGEDAMREASEGLFMQLLDQYDRGVRAADHARMKSSESSEKWSTVVTALKFGRLRVLCEHTASVARRTFRRVQHGLRLCLVAGFAAASAACPVMGPMPGSRSSVGGAASGAGGDASDGDLVLPPLARDVVGKLAEVVRTMDQARRVAGEAKALAEGGGGEKGEGEAEAASGAGASAVTGEAAWARKEDGGLRAERCCALALSHEVFAAVSASSLPAAVSLGPEGSISKARALHSLAKDLASKAEATPFMEEVLLHAGAGSARCDALAQAHEAAAKLAEEDAEYLMLPAGSRRVAPYNALDAMAPGADVLPGDATEALSAAVTLSLSLEDVPPSGQMPAMPLTNWEKPEPPMILPKPLHFDVAFEYTSPPVDALAERAGMDDEGEEEEEEAAVEKGAAGGGGGEAGSGMLGGLVKMFTG